MNLLEPHRTNLSLSLTIDSEVEPSAVGPSAGRAVWEEDATLVPSSVSLSDGREVDGALAQGGGGRHKTDTLLVAVRGGQHTVVTREHSAVLEHPEE